MSLNTPDNLSVLSNHLFKSPQDFYDSHKKISLFYMLYNYISFFISIRDRHDKKRSAQIGMY